jgi:hypothetical protein
VRLAGSPVAVASITPDRYKVGAASAVVPVLTERPMRLAIGLLTLALAALPAWLPAEPPQTAIEVLERFTVAGDGDFLIVPVTLKGKQYPFLVDTGSSTVVYDISLRPLLGRRLASDEYLGAEKKVTLQRFEAPEAFVGKLPLPRDEAVPVFDFTPLREGCGQDLRGCLGMSFLMRYVLRIDFDAGTLSLGRGVGPEEAQALPLHAEPVTRLPSVDVDVCGSGPPARLVVDTGCVRTDAGAVEADFFDLLRQTGKLEETGRSLGHSLGHTGWFAQGRLARLRLGPFEHRGVALHSSQTGRLGLGFWSRYRVTLDFPGGRLYLRKGKHFDRPERINRSGLGLCRREGKTLVEAVDPQGPAARAGVKAGDAVVAVAGMQADQARLFALRCRLCADGTTLPLTLQRDGRVHEVTLRLGPGEPAPTARAAGKP